MKAGRIVYSGFGTTVAPDPCSNMFQNFVSFFKPANQLPGDNCNVNIWPIGDKYYAITETSSMREIDPITLETGGRLNSSDFISIHTQVSFWFVHQSTDCFYQTGHPHTDRDGSTYILGTEFGRETNYCFFRPGFRIIIENVEDWKILIGKIFCRPQVKTEKRQTIQWNWINWKICSDEPIGTIILSLILHHRKLDYSKWNTNETSCTRNDQS